MNMISQEVILSDVLNLLNDLAGDWEYSGEITPKTFLFADLGFESIDAVVLASHVQDRYRRQLPFPQLLSELGHREVKDISVGELVEFIHRHLNAPEPGDS